MIFMANTILAGSPQETTTYLQRGRQLFEERSVEFRHERAVWWVPSCTGVGFYGVRLAPVEVCECADFEHRGPRCEHIIAASIAESKSRVCSCCGHRVLGRFTTEVSEDDGLLSWFPGDVLCADCIRASFWV